MAEPSEDYLSGYAHSAADLGEMPKKKKYCKRCGALIDNSTGKCDGCGKKYFQLSGRVIAVVLIGIVIIGLAGLNVFQYVDNTQKIKQLNTSLEDVRASRNKYMSINLELNTELAFWDTNAVICTTEGSKYHHYGCGHIEGREFYIFNTEYAEAKGYEPCLDCCG